MGQAERNAAADHLAASKAALETAEARAGEESESIGERHRDEMAALEQKHGAATARDMKAHAEEMRVCRDLQASKRPTPTHTQKIEKKKEKKSKKRVPRESRM